MCRYDLWCSASRVDDKLYVDWEDGEWAAWAKMREDVAYKQLVDKVGGMLARASGAGKGTGKGSGEGGAQ